MAAHAFHTLMRKRTVKAAVDALMTAALPVLMAYSLAGEILHEIVGTAMLVLFIVHHLLNRRAMAAMFCGRQTPGRILNAAVNLLLFAVMVLLPVSGIVMSKHLYTFLPTDRLSAVARTAHLLLSYWGIALMGLHLGLHAPALLGQKRAGAVFAALVPVAAFGAYVFVKNRIYEYMLLQTRFVFFAFGKPLILVLAENLSVIVLFAWFGLLLKAGKQKSP